MNVQTDSIVQTDIHQHRLHTRHHRIDYKTATAAAESGSETESENLNPHGDGGVPPALSDEPPSSTVMSKNTSTDSSSTAGWETIMLPLRAFVRTNYGFVVEPQTSILHNKIRSVGIGLTDRIEGPFDLQIHRIWATNGMGEEEHEEEKRICGENALPVDDNVRVGFSHRRLLELKERERELEQEQDQNGGGSSKEKPKGLEGLRSRWDE